MPQDLTEIQKASLDHAWAWFSMHAQQRVHSVNLYLVAFAFVVASYGTLLQLKSYLLAATIALAGSLISVVFLLLEERNRHLVKVGEAPLKEIEKTLAHESKIDSIEMLAAADAQSGWRRIARYSLVIRSVMAIGLIWMVASLAVALGALAQA